MNSYLEIAERVLQQVRRPLSAREILKAAYEFGIAPPHLRGRTQQKTLGARLSEDILKFPDVSRFYRTAPGRYFLREYAEDTSLPPELRRPIVARRRKRDLAQKRTLSFSNPDIFATETGSNVVDRSVIYELISGGAFNYESSSRTSPKVGTLVWSFSLVLKDDRVLTYRQGHYREDRDTFIRKRTVGFYSPVIDRDLTLFDQIDHGILSRGLRTITMDLDIRDRAIISQLEEGARIEDFVVSDRDEAGDLLAVLSFTCPDWFDPTTKRLAINDLEWLRLDQLPNDSEDFDPWSQIILRDILNLIKSKT